MKGLKRGTANRKLIMQIIRIKDAIKENTSGKRTKEEGDTLSFTTKENIKVILKLYS
ncbi:MULTISPECIES: hypothetical protein [Sphingobacterium]|uniref:Uncharacterized protein n=1 Tax=Sphingobacterium tenebrionis TaxID=3111775 RepID=A0ABU8I7W3_9SPHI|nr:MULTISPECIES: hypothetical protein [unclassified Sphingobacterium]